MSTNKEVKEITEEVKEITEEVILLEETEESNIPSEKTKEFGEPSKDEVLESEDI